MTTKATPNDAAERLLDKIGDWSVRLSQDPGDWGPEHRLWWGEKVNEALAAEHRATVERIRAKVNYRWSVGGELTRREVRAILDAEADR